MVALTVYIAIVGTMLNWRSVAVVSTNEEKEWSSHSEVRNVRAWRRPEIDNNAWHVYVSYGDRGYECDPGTLGESKEKALQDIEIAIQELQEAEVWIKDNLL